MSFAVLCPACRERKRVPDNAIGGRALCHRCGTMFTVTRERSLLEGPAVMDGTLAGAFAGTAAGLLIGAGAGAVAGAATEEAMFAGAVLGALGKGFSGVMIGFSIGAITGCLLGIAIRFTVPPLESQPRRAAALVGGITGALVGVILVDLHWLVLGAALGGGTASLWPILWRRLAGLVPNHAPPESGQESEAEVAGRA
jgi:hypothetical protein